VEPLYSLRNIEKKRENNFTLTLDRLDFFPGRFYTLYGPNGAGKSTLLDLLAFLSFPDRGELCFAGERARRDGRWLREKRKQVTLVHQSPFLFDATVFENVAFGLTVRGVVGRKQRERLFSALQEVGLAGFEKRRARGLSGGEAHRVALARALVLKPRVLLLDEPTTSVDAAHIRKLEHLFPLLTKSGMTVIMASHDEDLIQSMKGETLFISSGKLRREQAETLY
jgi:tungstate transport system ATP-binding protein